MNQLNPTWRDAEAVLELLVGPAPVLAPIALVVAHQDDESIAAAGSLARWRALTLIHVTNGAPLSAETLKALGYAKRAEYAAARDAELDQALQAAHATPLRRLCYGFPDGAVREHGDDLIDRLCADLLSVDAVITHPYEGGHVDHDAVGAAVQTACARLQALTGRAPLRLEYASYFRIGQDVRTGEFWPHAGCPERRVVLSPDAVRRKEAAFACFASQRQNLKFFSSHTEAFRRAPVYDLAAPPPPVQATEP